MNRQDSCKGPEIQLSFLRKTIRKMLCSWEALDCQKKNSVAPSPISFESFIFSFSSLGRGVLVPTLQMHESALPQAAPAVCLTRGAVSGRMDFLNLSSRFLYPHLLFCFPLGTFTNSSRYSSPFSPPLTFSRPIYTLTIHSRSVCLFLLSYCCPLCARVPPQVHLPARSRFAQVSPCAWGAAWAPHALGEPRAGHQHCRLRG